MGRQRIAYITPFLAFLIFLGISEGLNSVHFAPWGGDAMYLVFPVQTLVCVGILAWFWPEYRLRMPTGAWIAVGIGVLVFVCWVAPQFLLRAVPQLAGVLHITARTTGFDPDLFRGTPVMYWTELLLRLARTALVVPLLEEIFWRGFLLRYFIKEDFDSVPFGTYSRQANLIVAVAFMLEHSSQDWAAAIVAGLLYNLVAYRTKSLSSCVLAHALTNALLAGYILATRQWGFW
jgi:CAAX prenyl protease-like protein